MRTRFLKNSKTGDMLRLRGSLNPNQHYDIEIKLALAIGLMDWLSHYNVGVYFWSNPTYLEICVYGAYVKGNKLIIKDTGCVYLPTKEELERT